MRPAGLILLAAAFSFLAVLVFVTGGRRAAKVAPAPLRAETVPQPAPPVDAAASLVDDTALEATSSVAGAVAMTASAFGTASGYHVAVLTFSAVEIVLAPIPLSRRLPGGQVAGDVPLRLPGRLGRVRRCCETRDTKKFFPRVADFVTASCARGGVPPR